jgi:serine protease AprX
VPTRFLLPALLLVLAAPPARAARAALDDRIFAGKGVEEPASFLVVFRDEADLTPAAAISDRVGRLRFVGEALRAQAEVSQAPLRARLLAAGIAFRPFFLVNMMEVEAPRAVAEEISLRSEVSAVARNPEVALPPAPPGEPESTAPLSVQEALAVEPNLTKIGAPSLWAQGFRGQGIVVGIADTGFLWDHPALKNRYRGFDGAAALHDYNWHDAVHDPAPGNPCGASSPVPCDDNGHGTMTAGVSVGDDGAGNQIGVAPGARLIGCRNMDRTVGTPARYTECFEWFLAPTDARGENPRPDLAPHVINNSWGCPPMEGCTDPNVLQAVVDHVAAAGIFVVVAAGNSGSACSTVTDAPAPYASSFTVGATNLSDGIADFSSRGPVGSGRLKPDISAPGVEIRSSAQPSGFRSFSGTSAAAPHVTGAVALLWSASPELVGRVAPTAALLERTAAPLTSAQDCAGFPGSLVPNAVFGYGRLDVAAAALAAPPRVARPVPLRPPGVRAAPRPVLRRDPQ